MAQRSVPSAADPPADWPEIMTVPEAAAFLRVAPATIRVALASKRLPGKRIGKEWRLSKAALLTWLTTPGEPRRVSRRRPAAGGGDPSVEE